MSAGTPHPWLRRVRGQMPPERDIATCGSLASGDATPEENWVAAAAGTLHPSRHIPHLELESLHPSSFIPHPHILRPRILQPHILRPHIPHPRIPHRSPR